MPGWPVVINVFVAGLLLLSTNIVYASDAVSASTTFFTSIKKYAELSNANYLDQQKIQDTVVSYGDTLTVHGYLPGLGVNYFLTTNNSTKTHIIAIRGTANIESALLDVDIKLVDDKLTGTRIHKGFSSAAAGIFSDIKIKLNEKYKLTLTGHSLGGAVAQVLAMYLDVSGYRVEEVVTFGQPKVTNVTGAFKFRHLKITRVVTPKDLIPLIPPLDPMDINNLDIYWHAGEEVILKNNKDYSLTGGVQSMLRATKIFNEKLSMDNLKYHRMSQYLTLVNTRLIDAKEIPYENDFSGIKSLFDYYIN